MSSILDMFPKEDVMIYYGDSATLSLSPYTARREPFGFAMQYSLDPRVENMLHMHLPLHVSIGYTVRSGGQGVLRIHGIDRETFFMAPNGWIMGEWDPFTENWKLGVNTGLQQNYQWTDIPAEGWNSIAFYNTKSDGRAGVILVGNPQDVFIAAADYAMGQRMQTFAKGQEAIVGVREHLLAPLRDRGTYASQGDIPQINQNYKRK